MAKPVDYQNGRPVYNQASPGIGGAISDAIKAVATTVAPRAVMRNRHPVQEEEDNQVGVENVGRMKAAQSTDEANGTNY